MLVVISAHKALGHLIFFAIHRVVSTICLILIILFFVSVIFAIVFFFGILVEVRFRVL